VFVERALTYVLGYLLQADGAGGGKQKALKDVWRHAWDEGHALAIKLRADNDFYSQTSQVTRMGRIFAQTVDFPKSSCCSTHW